MGIPGGANLLLAAGGVSTYEIDQSLRYGRGSYLYRTPSSSGSRTTWTYSTWFKRGTLYNDTAGYSELVGTVFAAGTTFNQNDWNLDQYRFRTDQHHFQAWLRASDQNQGSYITDGRYRDISAWYHVVVVYDSTNSTAADRARFYINGERASASVAITITQNRVGWVNSTSVHRIGSGTSEHTQGYFAETHFLDGTAVTNANDFGEYDDNGVWRPIAYSGSYGTNGFYLKYDPSAANGVGHDHSGQGNHFSASGFQTTTSTASDYDVMIDTPTNNYPTYNPLLTGANHNSNLHKAMNDANLTLSGSSSSSSFPQTTMAIPTSGKWYCECRLNTALGNADFYPGIFRLNPTARGAYALDSRESVIRYYASNSTVYVYNSGQSPNSPTAQSVSFSAGDIIGMSVDMDNNLIRWYRNGTAYAGITGQIDTDVPHCFTWSKETTSQSISPNWGQRPLESTLPTGYELLHSSTLPAPNIKNPSEYFNTILYTGNATNRSITGVGFQPDFVWIKSRSSNTDHRMIDAVRGSSKVLRTNTVDEEYTSTTLLTSFNSDGFSLGTDNSGNANGENFVAWCWKAGGSGSSNTSGSITSTVSASPTSGFSIVTYSGAGANATVGHGLGVAPRMIWIKTRNGSNDWAVYHADLGASKILYLNLTYDQGGSGAVFGSSQTEPTSTVFTVGNHTYSGQSGSTYVAYCFAEVEGFSKIGSYVGNGNDDGIFIYLGFKPKWLLLKSAISTADDWVLMDVERSPYNEINDYFTTNHGNIEVTNSTETNTDFLSNGIKLRDSNGKINADGSTYIYMAFAEHPFAGADVSPALAR